MKFYQIYIPVVRDSDRESHKPAVWLQWHTLLCGMFGGYSDCGYVRGAWKDENGVIVNDTSAVYGVGADDSAALNAVADSAKTLFDQRTIFVVECGSAYLV